MKTVSMVGCSVAAKMAFELLAKKMNRHVKSITESYPLFSCDLIGIVNQVLSSDIVVSGMAHSAKAAKAEIASVEVGLETGKSVYLYADTFGVAFRDWFSHLIEKVDAVFVINEDEKNKVKRRFPMSNPVVAGNPVWFSQREPSISRFDARKILGAGNSVVTILVPGTKQEFADLHMVAAVADAMLLTNNSFMIVYCIHPGTALYQDNNIALAENMLNRLIALPDMSLNGKTRRITLVPNGMDTEKVQCGADIIVECLSSSGVIAAMRQQPLVTFFSPIFVEHMGYLNITKSEYVLTKMKASVGFDASEKSPQDFAFLLKTLMRETSSVRSAQKVAQKRHFDFLHNPCDLMFNEIKKRL